MDIGVSFLVGWVVELLILDKYQILQTSYLCDQGHRRRTLV